MMYTMENFIDMRDVTMRGVHASDAYCTTLISDLLIKLININDTALHNTDEKRVKFFSIEPCSNLNIYNEDDLEWIHGIFDNVGSNKEDSRYWDHIVPTGFQNFENKWWDFWQLSGYDIGNITLHPKEKKITIGIFDITECINGTQPQGN